MNRLTAIGIVILAITATLIWFLWPPSEQKEPETGPPDRMVIRAGPRIVQTPQSYEPARRSGGIESRKNQPERHSFRFFDTFAPLVKPFDDLLSFETKTPTEDMNASPISDARSPTSNTLKENTISIQTPLPASDPVFKKLYPDYYLDALKVLHRIMVNDRFFPDTAFSIPDEDALFAFLGATIDYAETKTFITSVDAKRFREALHGETRELLRQERHSFLKQLFDYFDMSYAFASIVTECYSDPYPFNVIPGVNVPFDFCCNCGLICPPVGPPVFVPDCSVKSCDVPLGCLNLICPNGNAIWDPMTGICGCDNPVSSVTNIPSILKNALNCIAPKQPAPPISPVPQPGDPDFIGPPEPSS